MSHADLVRHVRKRMKRLAITPYQLHQKLDGKISKQTVYNFVEHGRFIKTDTLLIIMKAVGLTFIIQPIKRHEK